MTPQEAKAIALRENKAGLAAIQSGRPDIALEHFKRAAAASPNTAEFHGNVGKASIDTGQPGEAVSAFRRAIALKPNVAGFHSHLSQSLELLGDLDEAIAAVAEAARLEPNSSKFHNNLGVLLHDRGRYDQAMAELRRAVEIQPDQAWAHFTIGAIHLLHGRFVQGWSEFDWREQCLPEAARKNFSQPRWNGGDLNGRTILLHAEQGLGDTLQFIRYVPLVAERGGRILLSCQRELAPLLQSFPGIQQVLTEEQPLRSFDAHCPLMTLPQVFRTTLESIPGHVPYIIPPRGAILPSSSASLRVGLAWAGQPAHRHDRSRSVALQQLSPLARIPNVHFFTLQKGPAAAQASNPPPGMAITDCLHLLTDMSQTASLIAQLDLVITVDTSIAHLAGAMAKPVWVLLPFVPDWRWMLDRADSPWYPTMRLFRQEKQGEWKGAIGAIASALRKLAEQKT
ncbi:MAG TPA: tetratricopeptide repeat protein [Tepidisphaeraceae bacterium]|nr:tetratricopeptide repeat protein [Tepidisphaeraceae bacterium]